MLPATLLALALAVVPVSAQEDAGDLSALPDSVAERAVELYNDPGTVRFSGRSRVPPGRTVLGDVAVLGGPFTVGGEVRGRVTVVNGDLVLEEGGRISGEVLVVGGRFEGSEVAVGGPVRSFRRTLRYVYRGEGIRYLGPRPVPTEQRRRDTWGRSRFTVRAGTNYNRVEGLPVMFGPILESPGVNRLRFDALAIWRSDNGFTFKEDEMGYLLRVDQAFLGGQLGVGGTLHSTVEPMERWGLGDLEASLTTFLLHQDYRDYYERDGWSGFVRLRAPDAPLELELEYRDEDHAFTPVQSPWALKDNDGPWRPQAMVAQGELRSLGARLTLDVRNDPLEPSDGWYVDARGRVGVGGSLSVPALVTFDPAGPPPVPGDEDLARRPLTTHLATGFLDLRRYNRVGPGSELHLRGILGGSLDGDPLPPQLQHALGGEGSLPGYPLFWGDCGARRSEVRLLEPSDTGVVRLPAFAEYGCDRIALFQAEYRSSLFFDWSIGGGDEFNGWIPSMDLDPSWAVFLDVGQGWSLREGGGRFDTGTLADLGAGFFLGDLGFYLAVPLGDEFDRGPNFFIRLDHRF